MRGLVLLLMCGLAEASPCYTTAGAAARAGAEGLTPGGASTGYRLQARRWDVLLGRGWATVVRCDAPELPAVTIAVASERPEQGQIRISSVAGRPAVVAGETVRVVYQDERMRMELAGVAEGSGNAGDRVSVRVARTAGGEGESPEQRVMATVRGAHSLELVAAGIGGRP